MGVPPSCVNSLPAKVHTSMFRQLKLVRVLSGGHPSVSLGFAAVSLRDTEESAAVKAN